MRNVAGRTFRSAGLPAPGLRRHVETCRNAVLPGRRLPLFLGACHVGYVAPELAELLADRLGGTIHPVPGAQAGALILPDESAARLSAVTVALAPRFGIQPRREEFDIRATPAASPRGVIDRGAIPSLGMIGIGVHLNGYVERRDGPHLWIARRARDKRTDPGKLDNLVGGGVPAGLSPAETLAKEADEEAGIPAGLIAGAREVARIPYAIEREGGLRRDLLVCYDLALPEDFRPTPVDGEVESFELWPAAEVVAALAESDSFKFNVPLVLLDFLQRQGFLPAEDAAWVAADLPADPQGAMTRLPPPDRQT